MPSVSAERIEITPGTRGGKPRISGTRIRVQDVVVWHEQMGRNPDEIVTSSPHLTLADADAALAYDPEGEIRRLLKEEETLASA